MTKRYTIFAARFAPLVGGVESYTANIAAELAREGNEVTVVTEQLDDSPAYEAYPSGVRVMRLPARSLMGGRLPLPRRNARFRELVDDVREWGADRVIVNNRFYSHSIDGLLFAESVGCQALLIDHGSAYLSLGSQPVDKLIAGYEHFATGRTKYYKPVYAGVSKKSAEWLKTFGITTDNVIPNAIDAPAFRALSSGRDYRADLGVPEEELLVAFVGRLAPEKGVDALVDAAAMLEGRGVHAVLAGGGPLGEHLAQRAPENVHFVGQLDKPDVSALLQQADVFCLPSRSEGFCTALLEASACGTPSVITDVGGVAEVIADSSMGIVMPDRTAESVCQGLEEALALGPAALAEMGERVRGRVERRFTWAASVRALEQVFAEAERR